jgi:hypothetical protein
VDTGLTSTPDAVALPRVLCAASWTLLCNLRREPGRGRRTRPSPGLAAGLGWRAVESDPPPGGRGLAGGAALAGLRDLINASRA